ncbi:MAG: transposase [Clostridia bacterium]
MNIKLNEIKKRKLEKIYISMYIIKCLVPYMKDNVVEKRELYVIYGVNITGNRIIIDIVFNKPNDNRFWLEEFEDIKARNVENIIFLISVCDKNIARAIKIVYNETIVVDSAIDIINEFYKFVPIKRVSDIGETLKRLFFAEDINKYYIELELIKEKYKDYKILLILLDRNLSSIKSYYKYCYDIRRLLLPYYSLRDMQNKIKVISNSTEYFTDIAEVIELLLEYINAFENGRSNNKKEWLKLLEIIYKDNKEKIERYI